MNILGNWIQGLFLMRLLHMCTRTPGITKPAVKRLGPHELFTRNQTQDALPGNDLEIGGSRVGEVGVGRHLAVLLLHGCLLVGRGVPPRRRGERDLSDLPDGQAACPVHMLLHAPLHIHWTPDTPMQTPQCPLHTPTCPYMLLHTLTYPYVPPTHPHIPLHPHPYVPRRLLMT